MMTPAADSSDFASQPESERVPLTRREREILGHLAEGMSGAQIAEQLVLSPETVRTHVRNAMAKLGASTRSQAVALALRSNEIARVDADPGAEQSPTPTGPEPTDAAAVLGTTLDGLVSLYDVDGGAIYLTEEDGLSLRQVGGSSGLRGYLPDLVFLGDGALGRAALERRAQLLQRPGVDPASGAGALIAAPMLAGGRLLGLIALAARVSRPIGRSELLLLQAFATRVGEVLLAGTDLEARLGRAMESFRASWAGSPRVL